MVKSISVYPKYVWVTAKGNVKDLKALAERISEEICLESRLFFGQGYLLAVKLESCTLNSMLGIICEHSDRVYIGYALPEVLGEHARSVYAKCAVERLKSVGQSG